MHFFVAIITNDLLGLNLEQLFKMLVIIVDVHCVLRSGAWKSGLSSEAITRVPGQLEQNGQVLRIPYKICVNLVYSSFGYVEN